MSRRVALVLVLCGDQQGKVPAPLVQLGTPFSDQPPKIRERGANELLASKFTP